MIVDRHVVIGDPRTAAELVSLLEYGGLPAVARDGIRLNARLRDAIAELRTFAVEGPRTPPAQPAANVPTMTAAEYAKREGRTRKAITDRCRRGTLPAELTPRGWRIFVDDQGEA